MFISVERADLAARYVNGDWTEIARILPLVDRYVRAAGWAASVMEPFLTLCERAKTTYPPKRSPDQVSAIVADGDKDLKELAQVIPPSTDRGAGPTFRRSQFSAAVTDCSEIPLPH